MKPHTLPIKRKPVPKGILHKLSAVTRSRKQRVAAATAGEMDVDDGGSKIARPLTIIFLIHIVAVGLIFVHQHFLKGRISGASAGAPVAEEVSVATPAVAAPRERESLPRLASGEKVYVVKPGDNYAGIAEREGVDEGDLRAINENVEIRPGLILSVPPRRIASQEPAAVASNHESQQTAAPEPLVNEDDGLVAAVDVAGAPRATAVQTPKPAAGKPAAATAVAGSRTHTVKSGDNIWRISQQYKVKQDALMKANNISDARKVRIGMKLVIPD